MKHVMCQFDGTKAGRFGTSILLHNYCVQKR